jgi:hypothetical protein
MTKTMVVKGDLLEWRACSWLHVVRGGRTPSYMYSVCACVCKMARGSQGTCFTLFCGKRLEAENTAITNIHVLVHYYTELCIAWVCSTFVCYALYLSLSNYMAPAGHYSLTQWNEGTPLIRTLQLSCISSTENNSIGSFPHGRRGLGTRERCNLLLWVCFL